MQIELPDVDWQGQGMTLASQFKKLNEEVGELAEALIENNPVTTNKELLDVIQASYTMLLTVTAQWEQEFNCPLPLSKFLSEHEVKLRKKGYLKPESTEEKITGLTEHKLLLLNEVEILKKENELLSAQVVKMQSVVDAARLITYWGERQGYNFEVWEWVDIAIYWSTIQALVINLRQALSELEGSLIN